MGRELRRKQAKKEGKSLQNKKINNNNNQIKKLIIITFLLVFIGTIIYLISALYITKELNWFGINNPKEEIKNVKNSILASATFKQSEEEYYVYYYDFNKKDEEVESIISNKLSSAKVYRVDTGSALNDKYVTIIGNKEAKSLDDLKVMNPTVIKIVSDKITEYYQSDEIIEKLK